MVFSTSWTLEPLSLDGVQDHLLPGWNRVASFDLESDEWKAMIDGPPVGYPDEDESWDITLAAHSLVQSVGGRCSRYTNMWLLVDSEKSLWLK